MPFSIESNKIYKASQKSVEQALKLVQENRKKRKATHEEDEKERKVVSHCKNFYPSRKKKRTSTTPFSKHLVLSQMRSYAMRENWQPFKSLFPMLFEHSNEIEPLIWRYALIVLLYSNSSSSSNLCHFFEMCTGVQDFNDTRVFRKLFDLNTR